jgi:hypothetical protein
MTFGKKSVKRMDTKHPQNKTYVLEVKARTLEAKATALKSKAEVTALKTESKARPRTLKAKVKGMNFCPRGSSRPRPVLEDYITGSNYLKFLQLALLVFGWVIAQVKWECHCTSDFIAILQWQASKGWQ